MRPRGTSLALAVVGAVLAASPRAEAAAEAPSHAASVQVTDLNVTMIEIPAGPPEARTLLLLGFRHEDQAVLEAWRRGLGLRFDDHDWLETPVIGVGAPPLRAMILHGMRRGVTDAAARAHIAPAFTAPALLASRFGVATDRPAAVVIDHEGQVVARASGDFDAAKAGAIMQALRH